VPLEFDTTDGGLDVEVNNLDFVSLSNITIKSLGYLISRMRTVTEEMSSVALTSAVHGEGTTFLSRALAAVFAHDYSTSVCWVDLNWWKRPGEPLLIAPGGACIAEAILGRCDIEEAMIQTSLPGLAVIAAGEVPSGSRSMVAHSDALASVVEGIGNVVDFVVLDVPPVLSTSDAVALSTLADGYILVVAKRTSTGAQVLKAIEAMEPLPFFGSVVNNSSRRSRSKRR
jgi:Mrp family chromosome partitioning ATPase